jgi:hypothetical protein
MELEHFCARSYYPKLKHITITSMYNFELVIVIVKYGNALHHWMFVNIFDVLLRFVLFAREISVLYRVDREKLVISC